MRPSLSAAIAAAVHARRPRQRHRSGDSLLAELMEQIGTDAAQRWQPEPCDDRPPHDERSVKAQRFLLRRLEDVTRSTRPATLPGISPGRERAATETTARASSRAVSNE